MACHGKRLTNYEKAIKVTRTPDIVHCNYAKAVHDLARIIPATWACTKSPQPISKIASEVQSQLLQRVFELGACTFGPGRKTGSAKDYMAAFEKYRRAAEIDPTDTAAQHSWHYALLELANGQRDRRRKHSSSRLNRCPASSNVDGGG